MSIPANLLAELNKLRTFAKDGQMRLQSDPFLAAIPVILQEPGVVAATVTNALSVLNPRGGKLGIVIIVMVPDYDITNTNAAGLMGEVLLQARVLEMPLINEDPSQGIGIQDGAAALRVARVWNRWIDYGIAKVVLAKGKAVEAYTRDQDLGIRGFTVTVRVPSGLSGGDDTAMPVMAVAPSGDDFEITLSTTTPDASIFYTIDGSYPGSGNYRFKDDGTTTLLALPYTVPFVVPAGTTVRAGAEHPERVPSDPAFKII